MSTIRRDRKFYSIFEPRAARIADQRTRDSTCNVYVYYNWKAHAPLDECTCTYKINENEL